MQLLVIEDDPKVARSVKQGLEEAGFPTQLVGTVRDALNSLQTTVYDLVVLDLGLPDGDGLEVMRHIRRGATSIPVILLTARDKVEDRVLGLDEGADDYIVKPFAFSELLARLRALLRRAGQGEGLLLRVGDLEVDVVRRRATRAGRRLDLSPREFELLEYLARSPGQAVSRESLARDVWRIRSRATPMDNIIDVHISHLRDKVDRPFDARLLQTVRGVGFMLAVPS